MPIYAAMLLIALFTAVLAAAIVALDWDLVFMRAWRAVAVPDKRGAASTDWTPERQPMRSTDTWTPASPPLEPAMVFDIRVPAAENSARTDEAERWLAAAAAGRLSEYMAAEPTFERRPVTLVDGGELRRG